MAEEVLTLESVKLDVRKSFGKVYSALKARELQTIRQIDAIWQQCGNNSLINLKRNCLKDIDISYANESTIFKEIHNFGVIDFKKLNIDSNIFIMEDYINPQDDHMYSYKCLDEVCQESDDSSLEATIEQDAFKQITQTDDCVCYVNIAANDVSKKFREYEHESKQEDKSTSSSSSSEHSSPEISKEKYSKEAKSNEVEPDEKIVIVCNEVIEDEKVLNDDVKKMNPTQDWLNQIINETETEPSQIIDLMEHSTIECS